MCSQNDHFEKENLNIVILISIIKIDFEIKWFIIFESNVVEKHFDIFKIVFEIKQILKEKQITCYNQKSEQNKSCAKVIILTKIWKTRDLYRLLKKIDLITQNQFKINNWHKLIKSTTVDFEK